GKSRQNRSSAYFSTWHAHCCRSRMRRKVFGPMVCLIAMSAVVHYVGGCGGSVGDPPASGSGGDGGAGSGSGGGSGGGGGDGGTLRTPLLHRPVAEACNPVRGPGIPDAGPADDGGVLGECRQDADCTKGQNGRCIRGRGYPTCSYDTCMSDGDC